MPIYVLDTDVASLLREGHPGVTRRIAAAPPTDLAVTVITVEEQVAGWYTHLRKAIRPEQVERGYRELGEVVKFLARFQFLNYTVQAIARYEALLKQKLNVRKNDLRIAAIALEAGAVVVTRNVCDFGRVPDLAVEDWTQPAAAP